MTDIISYVDTAANGLGDGTTQAHTGATGAYASLSAWEAARQQNLVTGGHTMTVLCAGGADTTPCVINGWTTGASNDIRIKGDPGAPDGDGLNAGNAFSASFYYMNNVGATTNVRCITCQEEFVTIEGLQFQASGTSTAHACIIFIILATGLTALFVRNCRFKSNTSSLTQDAITVSDADAIVEIVNCVVHWSNLSSHFGIQNSAAGSTIRVFNTVIYGASTGVRLGNGGTVDIQNSAIFGNSDDINNSGLATLTLLNCAIDDANSGTNMVNISPGTEATDWDSIFEDRTNGDFRLKTTGSPAAALTDAGLATGAPSTDILGNPYGTADIGAFAYNPGGGGGGSTLHVSGISRGAFRGVAQGI